MLNDADVRLCFARIKERRGNNLYILGYYQSRISHFLYHQESPTGSPRWLWSLKYCPAFLILSFYLDRSDFIYFFFFLSFFESHQIKVYIGDGNRTDGGVIATVCYSQTRNFSTRISRLQLVCYWQFSFNIEHELLGTIIIEDCLSKFTFENRNLSVESLITEENYIEQCRYIDPIS